MAVIDKAGVLTQDSLTQSYFLPYSWSAEKEKPAAQPQPGAELHAFCKQLTKLLKKWEGNTRARWRGQMRRQMEVSGKTKCL